MDDNGMTIACEQHARSSPRIARDTSKRLTIAEEVSHVFDEASSAPQAVAEAASDATTDQQHSRMLEILKPE
jgi:hypothetical protein